VIDLTSCWINVSYGVESRLNISLNPFVTELMGHSWLWHWKAGRTILPKFQIRALSVFGHNPWTRFFSKPIFFKAVLDFTCLNCWWHLHSPPSSTNNQFHIFCTAFFYFANGENSWLFFFSQKSYDADAPIFVTNAAADWNETKLHIQDGFM
jgi:hypothetical protein